MHVLPSYPPSLSLSSSSSYERRSKLSLLPPLALSVLLLQLREEVQAISAEVEGLRSQERCNEASMEEERAAWHVQMEQLAAKHRAEVSVPGCRRRPAQLDLIAPYDLL